VKVFYFWSAEEKNLGQFSKNYRTFYPKNLSLSSQKYGFGIRDPGIKKEPDPGSATLLFSALDMWATRWLPPKRSKIKQFKQLDVFTN
jgi:hypothetical protein